MQEQITFFVGTDVSKPHLDMSIVSKGIELHNSRIVNSSKSVSSWFKKVSKQYAIKVSNTLFCMEFTGIYNHPIVEELHRMGAQMWLMAGAQLSHGKGLQRGKEDKADAKKIALYGFTHPHEVRLFKKPRIILQQLRALMNTRADLIQTRHQYQRRTKESIGYMDKKELAIITGYCMPILKLMAKQIKEIDKEIIDLISSDEKLKELSGYIKSIDGIGTITTAEVLITTNEFENFEDAKKLACHCGVVPFKNESGISIKGKARVSHKANKKMKRLLHLAALSAIKAKGEFNEYYKRKIAEGKHVMSVLNAIRNKLVLRIFACVKNKRYYEKNYQYVLVKP